MLEKYLNLSFLEDDLIFYFTYHFKLIYTNQMDAIIILAYLQCLYYALYCLYLWPYYWPAPRFCATSAARKRGDKHDARGRARRTHQRSTFTLSAALPPEQHRPA